MHNHEDVLPSTHIKPFNKEDIALSISTIELDDATKKYVTHFCYVMQFDWEDNISDAFIHSRENEFNAHMEYDLWMKSKMRVKNEGMADDFEKSRFVVQAYANDGGNVLRYVRRC